MLSDLSSPQRELAEYMSALSERAYGASWMEGLEVALWRAASQGPFTYGRLELTPEHVRHLRELSAACGGWIFLHKDREESFASFAEWQCLAPAPDGCQP